MTDTHLLDTLSAYHRRTVELAARADENTLRRQAHPALSPLGWHVGHCTFIETYWVQATLLGEQRQIERWASLYFPELAYKPGRGAQLPGRDALITWCQHRHRENLAVLHDPPRHLRQHRLLKAQYLPLFLLQHYAQHLETMDYVRTELCRTDDLTCSPTPVDPPTEPGGFVTLPPDTYRIGCDEPRAYDNEQPTLTVELTGAELATSPVTNADYERFISNGGYANPALWDTEGWAWLCRTATRAPATWAADETGRRWVLTPDGWGPWRPEAAVTGLSHYEAEAFAAWAGARLPHEYEWEAARRQDLLAGVGEAWEWCANALHPYPGFTAFPYEGYSTPWFDGRHRVMRGASAWTREPVRRPSFRNFYTRDARHTFAGLRLAKDA